MHATCQAHQKGDALALTAPSSLFLYFLLFAIKGRKKKRCLLRSGDHAPSERNNTLQELNLLPHDTPEKCDAKLPRVAQADASKAKAAVRSLF